MFSDTTFDYYTFTVLTFPLNSQDLHLFVCQCFNEINFSFTVKFLTW